MGEAPNPALLPDGLSDLLPPEAEAEARAVGALMAIFSAHGYERVRPPLLEFEDGLLTGPGAAVADQIFRIMDPATRRMMGLRADMTPQVGRIATTRLAGAPRPLRLSYAGLALRVQGSQLAPDRQVPQVGIELVGADGVDADAEVFAVAAEALGAAGAGRLSLDLTLPALAPALIEASGLDPAERRALAHALDRKDAASVQRHGGALAAPLGALLLAAGPAEPALAAIAAAALPGDCRALCDRLTALVSLLAARLPSLRLTVDPVEFRGLRYHTGVCGTFYAPGRRVELGRGGRYLCGNGEAAAGVSLDPDALLRVAAPPARPPRLYVPAGADGAPHRAAGYATVAALGPTPADPEAEARRLGCTHVLLAGQIKAVLLAGRIHALEG